MNRSIYFSDELEKSIKDQSEKLGVSFSKFVTMSLMDKKTRLISDGVTFHPDSERGQLDRIEKKLDSLIKIRVDGTMPDNELRFEQDGKVVGVVKNLEKPNARSQTAMDRISDKLVDLFEKFLDYIAVPMPYIVLIGFMLIFSMAIFGVFE